VIRIRNPQGWRTHRIGDALYQIAQPVTLTPYASTAPCSARCQFCSENLREDERLGHASQLRPGAAYFSQLERALFALRGLPLSYSLSGLETTLDRRWLLVLLAMLSDHARYSPVQERVLYTNASGWENLESDAEQLAAICAFGLSRVEVSRHHFDGEINQQIMRFRPQYGMSANDCLARVIRVLAQFTTVKLVCVVQAGGIDHPAALLAYLEWARQLGVRHVIFRELSVLDTQYKPNATYRYIARSRTDIGQLLAAWLSAAAGGPVPVLRQITQGYYFTSRLLDYADMEVTFEASSYADLRVRHDSGRVYKIVFHANGNLCADWHPQRHVLLPAQAEVACHA
jgi:molybdenum cofactor biosynthesis enzyme MoaA